MKKIIFSIVTFLILPTSYALAQGTAAITINPNIPGMNNISTAGPCGWIVNFYTFALIFSGILAFGAIVFGGFKYATSAGNAHSQEEGRSWIWSALIGLLLLGGAYLILNTVNPNLTKCQLPTLSAVNVASSGGGASGGTSTGNGGTGTGGTTSNGNGSGGCGSNCSVIDSKISNAAAAYKGTSTANGPGSGNVACAWAVNNVLASAGIAALDADNVQSMENALTSGRGTLVDASQAQPGDIVIQGQDGHVGICQNVGCTEVISNSSSQASFTWQSNNTFSGTGSHYSSSVPSRIYQVNN